MLHIIRYNIHDDIWVLEGSAIMALTASFSDVRRDLSTIADRVMTDHIQVTVFRNNKPAFKIVPIDEPIADKGYLTLADAVDADYHDVFEALARET